MCKRKVSTKRRGREPAAKATQADPIVSRTCDIPPMPEDHFDTLGKDGKPVASISPEEGMVMPTTGKGALKRVFVGLGWLGEGGEKIDVDCCCAPFSQGIRGEQDTVWYRNLQSTRDKSNYCTIKHSGDVLSGQEGGSLEDLERIYVDLENMEEQYDCLAFEGNIYTDGLSFSSLSLAYIRLVNADTGQELARCSLGEGGKVGSSMLGSSRVLLFAKLFRGKNRWVLQAVSDPRERQLLQSDPRTVHPEMIPPRDDGGDSAVPTAQKMDRSTMTEADLELSLQQQQQATTGASGNKPKRSYLVPAVAIGTVAGVAAAVALFGPDPLDVGSMASDVFADGVDWGNLIPADVTTDCGCLHDCEGCGGFNLGDAAGDGCDACKDLAACGPCAAFCGLESPCDGLCSAGGALEPMGGVAGGALDYCGAAAEAAGDGCGWLLDAGQGCLEDSPCGDGLCVLFEGCGDLFQNCDYECCTKFCGGCSLGAICDPIVNAVGGLA